MIKPEVINWKDKPNTYLSLALVGAAVGLVIVAVFSKSPVFKAAVLAWVLMP